MLAVGVAAESVPLVPPIQLQSKVLSPTTVWLQWTDPSLGSRQQSVQDSRYYNVHYQVCRLIQDCCSACINVSVTNSVCFLCGCFNKSHYRSCPSVRLFVCTYVRPSCKSKRKNAEKSKYWFERPVTTVTGDTADFVLVKFLTALLTGFCGKLSQIICGVCLSCWIATDFGLTPLTTKALLIPIPGLFSRMCKITMLWTTLFEWNAYIDGR